MNLSKKKLLQLNSYSKKIRYEVLRMLNLAGSGHPGGSLSSLDMLVNLYFSGVLNLNKKNCNEKISF